LTGRHEPRGQAELVKPEHAKCKAYDKKSGRKLHPEILEPFAKKLPVVAATRPRMLYMVTIPNTYANALKNARDRGSPAELLKSEIVMESMGY